MRTNDGGWMCEICDTHLSHTKMSYMIFEWPKYFIITQSSKYDELNQKGHI